MGDLDSLRLDIVPWQADTGSRFQLLVSVNGVEMTAEGAGLGMDPYDVLIPVNHLVAAAEPRTVPIARCGCGIYGCGSTDVTISRDGATVRWDWLKEAPMPRPATFAADQYAAEVARVAGDHSWETPLRTAGRHVLTTVDRDHLLAYGLRPDWVDSDYLDPESFRVCLRLGEDYQVFVDTPWHGRDPETLARDVCRDLARPPHRWQARWSAIDPRNSAPPPIAGPSWDRVRF